MTASVRGTARLVLATAAATLAVGLAAAPAVAEPTDSAYTGPTTDESGVLPVVSVIEGMWSEYAPANSPPQQIAPVGQILERFVPTTNQIRDFFVFLQQFRPPAPISPPIG